MFSKYKTSAILALFICSQLHAIKPFEVILRMIEDTAKHHTSLLKNGARMNQSRISLVMSRILALAKSDDTTLKDTGALVSVARNVFFNEPIEPAHIDRLRAASLIDASGTPTEDAANVIKSSLEKPEWLDERWPELSASILRSPLKGQYLARPVAIVDQNYNQKACYRGSYCPHINEFALLGPTNESHAFPNTIPFTLRRKNEQAEGVLPYSYDFLEQFGFEDIGEYIDALAQAYWDDDIPLEQFHRMHRNTFFRQHGFKDHRDYIATLVREK